MRFTSSGPDKSLGETATRVYSWNQAELLSARQTEHTKVAPIEGENCFDPFTIRQVYQGRIGKLYAQIVVPGKNRRNAGEICRVEGNKFKRSSAERS